MTLKQQIIDDAKNVFMNTDDFAINAVVNGETFPVVRDVSSDVDLVGTYNQSQTGAYAGIVQYINRVYFADADYPIGVDKPTSGMVMIIDGERLQVENAHLESGMWRVEFKTGGNTWGL
jgi:hypothetical protein